MDNFLQDTNSLTSPSLSLPEIDITPVSVRNYKLADYSYELIMGYIKEFEDSLDNEHEVGVKLTSFGQSITMIVTDIGYANPNTDFLRPRQRRPSNAHPTYVSAKLPPCCYA